MSSMAIPAHSVSSLAIAASSPPPPQTTTPTLAQRLSASSLNSVDVSDKATIDFIVDHALEKLLLPVFSKQNNNNKKKRQLPTKVPLSAPLSVDEIRIILAKVRQIFSSEPLFIKLRNREEESCTDTETKRKQQNDAESSAKNASATTDEASSSCSSSSSPTFSTFLVGDYHGQFNELLRTFDTCGGFSSIFYPTSTKRFIFLGDYVDRGYQQIETFLLACCLKIKFPKQVYMLRGSHECAQINRIYGFYDEVKRLYNLKLWKNFIDVFNHMPVQLLLVEEKILCTPCGITPHANNLEELEAFLYEDRNVGENGSVFDEDDEDDEPYQVSLRHPAKNTDDDDGNETSQNMKVQSKRNKQSRFIFSSSQTKNVFKRDYIQKEILQRPFDIPDEGVITDLLWAEPDDDENPGWHENERGVSYRFGPDIVEAFLNNSTYSVDDAVHKDLMKKLYPEKFFLGDRQSVSSLHENAYKRNSSNNQQNNHHHQKERKIELIIRQHFVMPDKKNCGVKANANGRYLTIHSAADYKDSNLDNCGGILRVDYFDDGEKNGSFDEAAFEEERNYANKWLFRDYRGTDDEFRKEWKRRVKVAVLINRSRSSKR